MINSDEIIFLLGAGASADAKVRTSGEMISEIEKLLEVKSEKWSNYKDIYYLIKSSIYYSSGIKGNSNVTNFNIESLVNTIDELRKSDEHPLYPFVGSWIPKLELLSKTKLDELGELKELIVTELRDNWIQFELKDADYYQTFKSFKSSFNFPLRIFSLNYDQCLERACLDSEFSIEQGFDENREWSWQRYEESNPEDIDIFLYKLHGSINWKRSNGKVIFSDKAIDTNDLQIIFATSYKLQYLDPFLFFVYEFRRYTLLDDLKLIVSLGYSFGDEHINGILKQSIIANPNRILLSIDKFMNEADGPQIIGERLNLDDSSQIRTIKSSSKEFLLGQLSMELLESFIPDQPSPFPN